MLEFDRLQELTTAKSNIVSTSRLISFLSAGLDSLVVSKLKALGVAVRHMADFGVSDAWHVQQTMNQVGCPIVGSGGSGNGEVTVTERREGLPFFEGERALKDKVSLTASITTRASSARLR